MGGSRVQSPPELGDLGGEKDLCIHGNPDAGRIIILSPPSPPRKMLGELDFY